MHRDSITGNEIVDIDFLGKKLYPPQRMKQTDVGKEIERLLRELDRITYGKKKNSDKKSSFGSSGGGGSRKQPCTVKMFYTDDKKTHKNFLRNYMTQQNKKDVIDKPKLFNGTFDEVPEDVLVDYEENIMVDRGFKFIISPEHQKIPMKQLIRQYIKDLEKITGYHFTWFSAVHTDTEHIHTHLLINGVDRVTGEEIRFKPELIKDVARKLGSDICTDLVGPRSEEAIEIARQRLPYAKRWTKIDEHIASYGNYRTFGSYKMVAGNEFEAEKTTTDSIEIQRLNTLVELGLAIVYNKENPPKWYLEKGWQNKLKAIGRYNTYLDARNKLYFTKKYNLELYNGSMGKIEGVVSHVYNMDDENIWNNAIVIENKKLGKAWYVPTRIKCREEDIGKVITVQAEKTQKGLLRPLITIH